MHLTREEVRGLAKRRQCPRCDYNKTLGHALCRRCRSQLPEHMRRPLETIPSKEPSIVSRALRAAADYFNVHFQSVKNFGGGKKR